MMRRALAWLAWVGALLAITAGFVLAIVNRSSPAESYGFRGSSGLLSLSLCCIGFLIARRTRRNPIGWMLLIGGATASAQFLGQELATAFDSAPGRIGAWIDAWIWVPTVGTIIPLVGLLFPNGQLLSRRWRPVAGATILVIVAATIPLAFDRPPASAPNPWGVWLPPGVADRWFFTAMPAFAAVMALTAVSLFLRFRRSRGIERLQLKWFVFATALYPIAFVPQLLLQSSGENAWTRLAQVLPMLSVLGIQLSLAIAILRYKLFEIDRIINRTVVYASLTALLAAAYTGIVFALGPLLRPVGAGSDLATAASTLAVAALFRPLRSRIQAVVDRRFNRRRYNAGRTIDTFAARLRDEIDLESLSAELRQVVAGTMQPAHISVWLGAFAAHRTGRQTGTIRPRNAATTGLGNRNDLVTGER